MYGYKNERTHPFSDKHAHFYIFGSGTTQLSVIAHILSGATQFRQRLKYELEVHPHFAVLIFIQTCVIENSIAKPTAPPERVNLLSILWHTILFRILHYNLKYFLTPLVFILL